MSAPAPGPRASFSATGYADGLGRRTLVFDRERGAAAERLTLRAEFGAFERVLRDRAVQLAAWEGDGLARPTRVHREQPRSPLCVDADLPAGDRLIDVLDAAIEARSDQPLAGIDIALGFLLDVLTTLDRLHRRGRIVHGAIAPGRLLLSRSGRIVLLDALYGDALERLAWPPARLWRELGVAGPVVAADAAPGRVGDLSQVGLTALMLLLGRPLGEGDWPDGLSGALAEALEIGELHGGAPFASGMQALLDRLLPRATAPFTSALEAQQQARALAASAMGIDACEQALRGAAEAMANLPMPELPELRAIAEAPLPPPPQVAPAAPAAAPEPAVLDLRIDIPGDIPVPLAPAHEEPTAQFAATPAGAAPEPAPVPEIMTPAVSEPAPEAIPEMIPPEPVAGAPETDLLAAAEESLVAPEATAPKAESPRRHKRERRRMDGLRSSRPDAPAPPAAPPPVPAVPPPPAPVARPPVTAIRPVPRPTFPQPVFAEPGAYGAGGTVPVSPYLSATDGGRTDIPIAPAPLAPVPLQPPVAAIAVKGVPIVVKAAPRPKRERMAPSPYDAPPPAFPGPQPALRSRGTRWKIAAAAIVVLLVGIAAGRDYLPDRTQAVVPAGRTVTPASTNVAPAAPATGTLVLSSTPAGARVLVDGTAAGETPLTLEGVRPGRRTITFVASGGSVTRTVGIVAGETATLDVPVFSGWLAVDVPIVLEVAQNERIIGTTQSRLLMPPGRHTVTLTNADLGYRTTRVVDITPGEERRLTLVPYTEVNLNASPWAEVWIDGKRVGETPIARVSIPLGTREIIFRHPQYGERRLTPTIRVGAPEAISVDFAQPVAR
jgi:hypothetical protein